MIYITIYCNFIQFLSYKFLRYSFLIKRVRCYNIKTFNVSNLYFADMQIAYPADTKTSQRRRKNVLILVSKMSQIGLKWKSRRPLFKTSSRRLPGDVLKTSSKRRPQNVFQETSSRRPSEDVFQETSSIPPETVLRLLLDFFW